MTRHQKHVLKLQNLNKQFILESCKHKPEEFKKTKARFDVQRKTQEDKMVTMRLQNKISTMFSSKNLLSHVPGANKIKRMDSFLSIDNRSLTDLMVMSQLNELNMDFDKITNILKNKTMVGAKKLDHFQIKNQESLSSPVEFTKNKIRVQEMLAPHIQGIKLKNKRLKRKSKTIDDINPKSIDPEENESLQGEKIDHEFTNTLLKDFSIEKVEHFLFKQPLYESKNENLKYCTSDKQRLLKRREMIKSMKFLRKLGLKLRKEQKLQAKVIKKFERSLTSNKLNITMKQLQGKAHQKKETSQDVSISMQKSSQITLDAKNSKSVRRAESMIMPKLRNNKSFPNNYISDVQDSSKKPSEEKDGSNKNPFDLASIAKENESKSTQRNEEQLAVIPQKITEVIAPVQKSFFQHNLCDLQEEEYYVEDSDFSSSDNKRKQKEEKKQPKTDSPNRNRSKNEIDFPNINVDLTSSPSHSLTEEERDIVIQNPFTQEMSKPVGIRPIQLQKDKFASMQNQDQDNILSPINEDNNSKTTIQVHRIPSDMDNFKACAMNLKFSKFSMLRDNGEFTPDNIMDKQSFELQQNASIKKTNSGSFDDSTPKSQRLLIEHIKLIQYEQEQRMQFLTLSKVSEVESCQYSKTSGRRTIQSMRHTTTNSIRKDSDISDYHEIHLASVPVIQKLGSSKIGNNQKTKNIYQTYNHFQIEEVLTDNENDSIKRNKSNQLHVSPGQTCEHQSGIVPYELHKQMSQSNTDSDLPMSEMKFLGPFGTCNPNSQSPGNRYLYEFNKSENESHNFNKKSTQSLNVVDSSSASADSNSSSELEDSNDSEVARVFGIQDNIPQQNIKTTQKITQKGHVIGSKEEESKKIQEIMRQSHSSQSLSSSRQSLNSGDFSGISQKIIKSNMKSKSKEKVFKTIEIDGVEVKVPFSPMLNRNDQSGKDDDLDDMEEFYLIEIEQVHYADLMEQLQKREKSIQAQIIEQKKIIEQLKLQQKQNYLQNERTEVDILNVLKNKLYKTQGEMQQFAFNMLAVNKKGNNQLQSLPTYNHKWDQSQTQESLVSDSSSDLSNSYYSRKKQIETQKNRRKIDIKKSSQKLIKSHPNRLESNMPNISSFEQSKDRKKSVSSSHSLDSSCERKDYLSQLKSAEHLFEIKHTFNTSHTLNSEISSKSIQQQLNIIGKTRGRIEDEIKRKQTQTELVVIDDESPATPKKYESSNHGSFKYDSEPKRFEEHNQIKSKKELLTAISSQRRINNPLPQPIKDLITQSQLDSEFPSNYSIDDKTNNYVQNSNFSVENPNRSINMQADGSNATQKSKVSIRSSQYIPSNQRRSNKQNQIGSSFDTQLNTFAKPIQTQSINSPGIKNLNENINSSHLINSIFIDSERDNEKSNKHFVTPVITSKSISRQITNKEQQDSESYRIIAPKVEIRELNKSRERTMFGSKVSQEVHVFSPKNCVVNNGQVIKEMKKNLSSLCVFLGEDTNIGPKVTKNIIKFNNNNQSGLETPIKTPLFKIDTQPPESDFNWSKSQKDLKSPFESAIHLEVKARQFTDITPQISKKKVDDQQFKNRITFGYDYVPSSTVSNYSRHISKLKSRNESKHCPVMSQTQHQLQSYLQYSKPKVLLSQGKSKSRSRSPISKSKKIQHKKNKVSEIHMSLMSYSDSRENLNNLSDLNSNRNFPSQKISFSHTQNVGSRKQTVQRKQVPSLNVVDINAVDISVGFHNRPRMHIISPQSHQTMHTQNSPSRMPTATLQIAPNRSRNQFGRQAQTSNKILSPHSVQLKNQSLDFHSNTLTSPKQFSSGMQSSYQYPFSTQSMQPMLRKY